jgi:ADP-ribose pyrophosphatase YjhB (NUDIX family)
MVFYENPLPVAASVVLNEQREVLLVRRKNEPHKGEWCLPIGFAEVQETIAEAARRELKEETGIEGGVLRLLDADSYESDFYGELLIVSFELQKIGGAEEAGDDAEEVAYFPLDKLPPLAFSSNLQAIQACVEAHRDDWAIQDSFESLHYGEGAESGAYHELLSDALVSVIEGDADKITKLWVDEVRSNPTTASYRRIKLEDLMERCSSALSQFRRWLRGRDADNEVRDFYRNLGRERKAQGFAIHETLSSLTLLRKHVFTYSRHQGVYQRPIDVYRVLELNRRISVFFDKALYHTVRGFEEAGG